MNKILFGTVTGLKSAKTATVKVDFTKLHSKYLKPIKRKKYYQVHNEGYDLKLKDKVVIKSSRPISKTKKFLVVKKEENKNQSLKQEK